MYFEFETQPRQVWAPQVDVCERVDEIVIFVEMPGVERADIQISWHDGVLTIAGVKRQPISRGAQFHCAERAYGPFRRDLAINISVDHSRARAELRDGLMRIYLPKRTATQESSTIPITD
jgi:HSP20 family protein